MKKFFSAFLLMAAMAFSVSTFVACNDVVGEIEDVKAQTTQNAANIEQLQADLKAAKDEAAAAAAAALQAAKDAQKAGDDAMAYAKAAEASAQKALEEAIAEADAALKAHINDFNTKYDLINETLGQKADKTELTKAIADLKAELQTEISSVRTSVEELDKKIDDEVSKLNTKIDDNKKAFDKEIADLKAADVAINTELTKLNSYIETVKTDLKKEISDSTKALRDAVAKAVEEMNKIKAELVAEDARLAGLINTNAAEIKKNADAIAQNATSIADLRTDVNGLLEDVNDAKELLAAHAEDLKNLKNEISNLKTQFDTLTGRVDALFARIQSIVYVPTHSDGKATLDWAILTAHRLNTSAVPATVLPKESKLTYLVKAEDAASVASTIADNPEVLRYVVKGVQTRAAEEAVLDIVDVVADGEYITVTVIAKNFEPDFYTDSPEGSYSAALVLDDNKTNTRSTEFTNLIAADEYEEYMMAMFLAVEDPELVSESMRMLNEGEVITHKMPCNDTNTKKSAVKPIAGFVPVVDGEPVLTQPVRYYTAELLEEEGYFVPLVRTAYIHTADSGEEGHIRVMDPNANMDKCEGIDTKFYFEITEAPKWDYHYKVLPDVSFDKVGEKSTVTYVYTCGNVVTRMAYDFVLAKAQVDITIEKNVNWTFDFAQKYFEGKNTYLFWGLADADKVTVKGTDSILDLVSVINQTKVGQQNFVKGYNGWVSADRTIVLQPKSINDKGDMKVALQRGTYSFNNSYKMIYSTYTDNVEYNTTFIVNLVNYQPTITVPVAVDYKLDGKVAEFVAPVDLAAAAYDHLVTDKYDFLGFGENNKTYWNTMFNHYKTIYGTADVLSYPVVNANDKVQDYNCLKGLTEARIKLAEVKDGDNTVTWDVWPVAGFNIKFVITGKIVKPAGGLIYADSYVENATAVAKGLLVVNDMGQKEYTINAAHLPYYFNVAGVADANKDNYADHNYTVKFTVNAPNSKVDDNVKVVSTSEKVEVPVLDRAGMENPGSFWSITDDATLYWDTYTGLYVTVTAQLYANGYPVDTKELRVETHDPLTFEVKDIELPRALHKGVQLQIFKNATVTSAVEDGNLVKFVDDNNKLLGADAAFQYVEDVYGVDVVFSVADPTADSHVYFYNNSGEKEYLPGTQYSYVDGLLTVNGDDSLAKTYYADFTAKMTSRICAGEHVQNFRVILKGQK